MPPIILRAQKNYLDMLSDERLRNAIFVTLKNYRCSGGDSKCIGPSDCDDAEPGEANDQRIFAVFFFLPYVLSTVAISFYLACYSFLYRSA